MMPGYGGLPAHTMGWRLLGADLVVLLVLQARLSRWPSFSRTVDNPIVPAEDAPLSSATIGRVSMADILTYYDRCSVPMKCIWQFRDQPI